MLRNQRAAQLWSAMKLERFGLNGANEALEAVATGTVVKALIDPWKTN
jgi:hypothetical protein